MIFEIGGAKWNILYLILAAIGSATILFLKFSMPVDIYFELCGAKLIGGGNLGIGERQQSLPPNENLANESQPL